MLVKTIVCGPLSANSYLVIKGAKALLIDAGDDVSLLEKSIGNLTLSGIVLTHAHFDHVLAAPALAKKYACPVYAHPADIPALATPNGILYQPGLCRAPFAKIEAQPLFTGEGAIGDFAMCVYHTPGHTRGGVSLRMEDALFTGDTLFLQGWGRTDFPGGDETTLFDSLKMLLTLPGDPTVYSGHGPSGGLRSIAARYGL